ncbi:MAG: threonine synthase [Lentisphaerae bacterium]|nr:threonine synthase [Lentisphaerota bacterium]
MKYFSTRNDSIQYTFQEVVMTGLARDGGLFLPATIPDVTDSLKDWAKLSYRELALNIFQLYTGLDTITLRTIIDKSYSTFRYEEITPVVEMGDLHIMELFHGPTLAFKDVALQFLGNLFEHFLKQEKQILNIVAATSGDTGSAAIYGVRGKQGIRIFVMFPEGRISPAQERQMTSVLDDNVVNIALEGTFDDCQNLLKSLFNDLEFKDEYSLGSVNSINWARILAQIVYYFYGAFRVMEKTGSDSVRFSVPTGNFGDIFAGFVAHQMGLPIQKLILAANENDILSRFFKTGVYRTSPAMPTLSPSMDIQVASNFERYLYYKLGKNSVPLKEAMEHFAKEGEIKVNPGAEGIVDSLFAAESADTEETLSTIKHCYEKHNYLLDPHTAVGVNAAVKNPDPQCPTICLATAHPAKFDDAVKRATGKDLAYHEILERLKDLPVRKQVCANSAHAVRRIIEEKSNH